MKFNKHFLLGIFMLFVLMLTCVNAADVSQENTTLVEQSDVLGDSYYDDDFYINVEENYVHDKESWDSNYIVYIYSQSQSNGNFSILVNDTEKLNISITDGYFSCEDDGYGGSYNRYYEYIYPGNLSLDIGNYNIKVNFNGNTLVDNDVLLKEKDDFDIFLSNPYYCDDEDYWNAPSFIIIDSNHANNGTLEVLVNGTKRIAYNVTNGNFDYIPDCRNVSRYIAPSDILDDYGTYNIKITFTENGMTKVLKEEIVSVIGPQPTTDPKLEMSFYFDIQYLRADNVAYIYLPREATGNLTISYNNHEFNVPYSKGYAEHEIKAWNVQYLGETLITATYVGDDFGTLTTNGTIIVTPGVKIPYYASLGEEFTISMTAYDWVNGGKFDVYDYNGDVKGDLKASGEINWGVSSVSVSSDTLGLNKFYLEYDTLGSGKYYSIQEVNIIENSKNVSVYVPFEVPAWEDFNITITSPPHDFNFVSIAVDGKDPEFYPIFDGNLTKTMLGLSRGYHKIVVQYDNQYYEDGKWTGDVYSNTFNVNAYADINFDAPELTKDYMGTERFVATMTDGNNYPIQYFDIKVIVDNQTYVKTTDHMGRVYLDADFDAGVYPVTITDDHSYATSKITVNKLDTNITLSIDPVTLYDIILVADVNPYYLEGNVSFSVNDKNYTSSIRNSEATSYLNDLSGGIYVIQAFYEGDVNYKPSSSNVIELTIDDHSFVLLAPNVTKKYGDPDNFIVTVCDDNGNTIAFTNVNITFNGKTYEIMTDVFGNAYYILDCDCGDYDVVTQYKDIVVYSKVIINKLDTNATLSYDQFNDTSVYLYAKINPIIECGDVVFSVNNKNYTATTTPLSEALMILVDLEDDNYTAVLYYNGDANHNPCISNAVEFNVNTYSVVVSAPDITKYYKGPERFVVTVCDNKNNPIANAKVNITLNGQKYSRTTNDEGMASIAINLNSGIHEVITQYGDIEVKSTVTVKPTVSGENVTKIYRNQTQYYATFVDTEGNLLTNTPVKFNINGVYYTRTTNASGVAKMNINLNPGTYIITAENPNSTELYSNIVNVLPSIVENRDLTKYYKNDSQYIVKILGDDGKAVGAGVKVTFNINGVFYNRTTNASGHAKLNINLNPSTYIVTAEYNGLKVSNKITVLSILEAKDLNMKYRDGSKFEVKLVDGKGKPFAGQAITFNINGVFYNRNTDAGGFARLNINLMAGQYIITSMYKNGATISNKVTISS